MSVRRIDVRERVMERNDSIARGVRERLAAARVVALNLLSSPGSGKTTLLERTLDALRDDIATAVVAGDVQTENDARRLERHTERLVQAVVTGGACHLDARQVEVALEAIALEDTPLLIIENVGNLVCPASWDLGEAEKIALFSVTEGEDKPAKYPKVFRSASTVVMTKVDLLPYVPFDLDAAMRCAREVNPALRFFVTSALTGEGLPEWLGYLRGLVRQARPGAAALSA